VIEHDGDGLGLVGQVMDDVIAALRAHRRRRDGALTRAEGGLYG
jgi:hypothetical protein